MNPRPPQPPPPPDGDAPRLRLAPADTTGAPTHREADDRDQPRDSAGVRWAQTLALAILVPIGLAATMAFTFQPTPPATQAMGPAMLAAAAVILAASAANRRDSNTTDLTTDFDEPAPPRDPRV